MKPKKELITGSDIQLSKRLSKRNRSRPKTDLEKGEANERKKARQTALLNLRKASATWEDLRDKTTEQKRLGA